MNEKQFNALIEILRTIEKNTKKEIIKQELINEYTTTSNPKSSLISECINEAVQQVQELFFSKLQSKTGWGRNEVKELFVESIKEVRTPPISRTSLEELPWQR